MAAAGVGGGWGEAVGSGRAVGGGVDVATLNGSKLPHAATRADTVKSATPRTNKLPPTQWIVRAAPVATSARKALVNDRTYVSRSELPGRSRGDEGVEDFDRLGRDLPFALGMPLDAHHPTAIGRLESLHQPVDLDRDDESLAQDFAGDRLVMARVDRLRPVSRRLREKRTCQRLNFVGH